MTSLADAWTTYLSYCNDRRLGELGDFVHNEITFNDEPVTLHDYAAAIGDNIRAVPDFHWEIEDIVASGDTVAVRLTDTGTPQAEWLGLVPAGKSFRVREFAVYRFRDHKIAQMWFVLDVPAIAAQLG